jgi:hypothetical protein
VPGPLARASYATFRRLAALRGSRSLHPDGLTFAAELQPRSADLEAEVFRGPSRPALVRMSRGVGLPGTLPDVLGLGIRVPDAYGQGRHQDFLLVTSGSAPVLRHLILPGPRGFFRHTFSSVLPYAVGGRMVVVGALPAAQEASPSEVDRLPLAAPGGVLELRTATLFGGWEPAARLELGPAIPADESAAFRLNPWNAGGGLRPTGPLMGLRDPAYRGSQDGGSSP